MNQVERAIRVAEKAIKERDERIQQLEEALRYIAEFDFKMKMHPSDAPMNVVAYAFALGVVQGRARAALGDLSPAELREPRDAEEAEGE